MTKQQERAVRTRTALVRSASEAFQRRGYAHATVAEIAAGAGVSSGALHFHFENKGAIAAAVVEAAADGLYEAACEVRAYVASPLQVLVDLTHAFAVLFRTDAVVRAGFRLSGEGGDAGGRRLRDEWHDCLGELLRRAEAEGQLTEGLPPESGVKFVSMSTAGIEFLGRGRSDWLSQEVVTEFWRVALRALAAPAALGSLRPQGSSAVVLAGSRGVE